MKDKIGFESIKIVAKLTDGTYRSVLTSDDDENMVLNLLQQLHGGTVKVHEDILEGIEFNYSTPTPDA